MTDANTTPSPGTTLRISVAQRDALDRAVEELFISRLLTDFGEERVARLGAARARESYGRLVAAARAHGFVSEFEVAAFVRTCEHFGDNFLDQPQWAVTRILRQRELPVRERARRMDAECDRAAPPTDPRGGAPR